jgi:hypothetical protein
MKYLILGLLVFSNSISASTFPYGVRFTAPLRLPNSDFAVEGESSPMYKTLAASFKNTSFDFRPQFHKLKLSWPLADRHHTILEAFSTPEVFRLEIPWEDPGPAPAIHFTFNHQAIDVIRSDLAAATTVFAPVSGYAVAIANGGGFPEDPPVDYLSLVAIYDPRSHLILGLLHVVPTPELAAATTPLAVTRGQVIGELSEGVPVVPVLQQKFRHTHVFLMSLAEEKIEIFNPLPYFSGYRDHISPTVNDVTLLDENGQRIDHLKSGRLDVIVDAYDRDDHSDLNFPIWKIKYTVTDQSGRLLATLSNCNTDLPFRNPDFTAKIGHIINMFDLGNMKAQLRSGIWDSDSPIYTNVSAPNRSFLYAPTNFKSAKTCIPLSDADGFIEISDAITSIRVFTSVMDYKGNRSTFSKFFSR